jgi:hypothetical protein
VSIHSVELVQRVVTVSMETVRLVRELAGVDLLSRVDIFDE